MPPINLTIHSFTPPSPTSPTPLSIKLTLPSAQQPNKNALHPATHLQLAYTYTEDRQEIFNPKPITSADLVLLDAEEGLYELDVAKGEIPKAKSGGTAEVVLYALAREEVLGRWSVGEVEMEG
ncbi:hypothetical protein M409DRAFT_25773 [Zasmidium cellare ATCC 36951]|uniref:Uncharacterized protein n=1 Tax=Zasmidium cellare ATCC 36951 TaxID=1080233 RepID=A0A6A6CCP6_ZASCE|nr:uncharacterized protein M409DRAFT_25773 [Zasmidium cellare ATCC 36951]KAF2164000.1 hypothetical protein M409DRAFT_25773 [Zasmidium cellare ATCC 36951]